MDSAANDKFANELKQALGSFLGLPVNATTSLLTDLLYSLEAQTRIMEQFNGRDEKRLMTDALDSLLTVCEKLPKAQMLRSYVGRMAGTQDVSAREKLMTELLEHLTAAKRRQKKFF